MNTLEIKPGDILFVWGNGFIDEAIEDVTGGPSHVALFLNSQTLAEAQGGKETGAAPLSEYAGQRCEVWTDETLTNDERSKMVEYANSQFGTGYDYLAILSELVRFELKFSISFHEGKRRICSSFVNDCGKSVGRNWSNLSYTPAPIDLLKGGELTKKGDLSNGK